MLSLHSTIKRSLGLACSLASPNTQALNRKTYNLSVVMQDMTP